MPVARAQPQRRRHETQHPQRPAVRLCQLCPSASHLGELLVEQRRLRRTLACLKSKIERIHEALDNAVKSKDLDFHSGRNNFLKLGGVGLSRYTNERSDSLTRMETLNRQIIEIDGHE